MVGAQTVLSERLDFKFKFARNRDIYLQSYRKYFGEWNEELGQISWERELDTGLRRAAAEPPHSGLRSQQISEIPRRATLKEVTKNAGAIGLRHLE
jgi:hypothetical protein